MRVSLSSKCMTLCLAATVLAISAASATVFNGGEGNAYGAEFVGNSGQIKLYTSANSGSYLKLAFESIDELDASGAIVNSHRLNNLASVSKTTAGPIVTSDSVRMWTRTTPTIGSTPVEFTFNATLYNKTTAVPNQYNNATRLVSANALKLEYYISNWPFVNSAHNLSVSWRILTPGSAATATEQAEAVKVDTDTGVIEVENHAQYRAINSGTWRDVEIKVTTTQSGSNTIFSTIFPSFSELHYDPTLALSGAAANAASMVLIVLLAVASVYMSSQL